MDGSSPFNVLIVHSRVSGSELVRYVVFTERRSIDTTKITPFSGSWLLGESPV